VSVTARRVSHPLPHRTSVAGPSMPSPGGWKGPRCPFSPKLRLHQVEDSPPEQPFLVTGLEHVRVIIPAELLLMV
jgi:hypothetical protein